jgi:hypothetical protein
MSREAMSGLPPGAVGMMMRSGRCGQLSCARAGIAAKAAVFARKLRRVTNIRASPRLYRCAIFPDCRSGASGQPHSRLYRSRTIIDDQCNPWSA